MNQKIVDYAWQLTQIQVVSVFRLASRLALLAIPEGFTEIRRNEILAKTWWTPSDDFKTKQRQLPTHGQSKNMQMLRKAILVGKML